MANELRLGKTELRLGKTVSLSLPALPKRVLDSLHDESPRRCSLDLSKDIL